MEDKIWEICSTNSRIQNGQKYRDETNDEKIEYENLESDTTLEDDSEEENDDDVVITNNQMDCNDSLANSFKRRNSKDAEDLVSPKRKSADTPAAVTITQPADISDPANLAQLPTLQPILTAANDPNLPTDGILSN